MFGDRTTSSVFEQSISVLQLTKHDLEASMWIVRLALRRPYTFVVVSMLILFLGVGAAIETPKDIFPYIDIPVVTIVWTYGGLTPNEMEGRVVTVCERALTTTVN